MKTVDTAKRTWVRPALKTIKAGAAESQTGMIGDGGGGSQGS
jgi:hypothetical protein